MQFVNTYNIPKYILEKRLSAIDADMVCSTYVTMDDNGNALHIVSVLTDADMDTVYPKINASVTDEEQTEYVAWTTNKQQIKNEYLSTISTLQQIEDTVSPTNAQVISAVKFLAKTIRLIIKFLARFLF